MTSWTEKLPSGKYQARYTLPNGAKRSAGTFVSITRARKEAAIAEEKAASLGWRDPKAASRPWGEWCEEWWPTRAVSPGTLARDVSPRDKHLMPRWGAVPLAEITRHDVKAWAASLARAGLAPASVQRHTRLFSASLTAAIDAEVIVLNPAARLKLPSGETDEMRFLTHAEAGQLLDSFTARDRPFISLLLNTGLRYGEGVGLQTKRLDVDRRMVRVAEVWDDKTKSLKAYPKGKKIRDVPISGWALEEVATLTPVDGFVFARMDYANWRHRVWEPALATSGLGHVRPHDLRHTYASWLLQDGVDLAEVGRLLGHVSWSTTQRYAHLAETPHEQVRAAMPDPRVGRT